MTPGTIPISVGGLWAKAGPLSPNINVGSSTQRYQDAVWSASASAHRRYRRQQVCPPPKSTPDFDDDPLVQCRVGLRDRMPVVVGDDIPPHGLAATARRPERSDQRSGERFVIVGDL